MNYGVVYAEEARNGFGLHAAKAFRAGQNIVEISGRVHHWRELLRRGGTFLDNCFRYDEDHYLDPGEGPGRYLNHSCNPNAGIRKEGSALMLWAARRIRADEEILIDYSTITGDDDVWRMYCRCGSKKCRRWITRFALLPPALKRSYLKRGLLAEYMLPTLE